MTDIGQRVEFRLVIERPLGPQESRVERTEQLIENRDDALWQAGYWKGCAEVDGARGWVETRAVALWEDFRP